MRDKSVAVLDIRSSEVCAVIAEKGVNNTFIIKSKYSRGYEGYAEGSLLDIDDFIKAVRSVLSNLVSSAVAPVKQLYVSIPCEFVNIYQTDKVISFHTSQKITAAHVKAIEESSVPEVPENECVIKCGALYYVLSDKRRLLNPVGMASDSLRAKFSFFTCNVAFRDTVIRAAKPFKSIKVFNWLPQSYIEGNYLIDSEKKKGYTALFDFGYISSTFSVICGNGVAFSEAFSVGIGHIAVLLMEALDIPFDVATEFIKQVNLNAKERASANEKYVTGGEEYSCPASELRDLIKEGLDGICEMLETCIQSFVTKDMTGAPIYITGEGVGVLRGTIEHLSSRLVTPVETVAPKVPYYDKPKFSSLFSLLHAALGGDAHQ